MPVEDSQSAQVGAGGTQSLTLSWATASDTGGDFSATVASANSSASASITVDPQPPTIDSLTEDGDDVTVEWSLADTVSDGTVDVERAEGGGVDWPYRKAITIDSAKVDGDLSDWPLLVHLDSDSDLADHAQSSGDDIKFEDDSGTQLSHEIESYDSNTGTLWAHVKLPSVSPSSDTTLYIYYGNTDASNQESVADVWSNGFEAVYHLNEDSAPMIDSVGNADEATSTGPTRGVNGQIDTAYDFDGVDDYISTENNVDITKNSELTISMWVNLQTITGGNDWFFNHFVDGSNRIGFFESSSLRFYSKFAGNTAQVGVNVNEGVRYHLTGVHNTNKQEIYLDGASESKNTDASPMEPLGVGNNILGDFTGDSGYFTDCLLDEIRLSSTTRSDAWISTTYANQNTPLSFYSVGTEESLSSFSDVATGLSPSTTSYTDTTVSSGETYEYRVQRVIDSGSATSATASITTGIRRSVTASGAGDATAARTAATDRSVTAAGVGAASVARSGTHSRALLGSGGRGDATVSRTLTGTRAPLASGTGAGTIARTATADRALTADGAGAAVASRTVAAARELLASGAGDATVSRTTTASRSLLGSGTGAATIAWRPVNAWALPTAPASGRRLVFTPDAVATDYDELTLSTVVTSEYLDELDHYRTAGDVDRETTAFGAWRRIPRDATDPLTIYPADEFSPPFDERRVVPLDASFDEVSPQRQRVELTLGLEEPRPREPLSGDGASFVADELAATVDAGATESLSLSWTPAGSQLGEWVATVSAAESSDSTLVSVTDAPYVFSWPVATLTLTERQVGQVSRSQSAGVPTISLPLRLNDEQAAVLLAVGSRVEAVQTRGVPDGPNYAADTLPGAELTVSVDAPAAADIEPGTYAFTGWDIERTNRVDLPYVASVEFIQSD